MELKEANRARRARREDGWYFYCMKEDNP